LSIIRIFLKKLEISTKHEFLNAKIIKYIYKFYNVLNMTAEKFKMIDVK